MASPFGHGPLPFALAASLASACGPNTPPPTAPATAASAAPAVIIERPPMPEARPMPDGVAGPNAAPIANPAGPLVPLAPVEADPRIESLAAALAATAATDPDYAERVHHLGRAQVGRAAWLDQDSGYTASQAQDAWTQTIVTLSQLTGPSFASYPALDEALFLVAVAYGQIGKELEMQAAYMRLINDYPTSPLVAHAYLVFGNYYYQRGKIEAAMKLYERATQLPDSEVYAYALYRLAWCHLGDDERRARPDKALNYFFSVVEAVQQGRVPNAEAGAILEAAAQFDMIHAYARAGVPGKAEGFFEQVAPGRVDELLRALADEYASTGMSTEQRGICTVLEDRGEPCP